MSKYSVAMSKIEQERLDPNVRLVSEKSRDKPTLKKSPTGLVFKWVVSVVVICAVGTGAYFLRKPERVISAPAPPQILTDPASFFTIQLITYRIESRATEEAAKLGTEGYEAFVLPKDGYFQLCLGKFAHQNLANEELNKLKNTLTDYQGMFVRFVHE